MQFNIKKTQVRIGFPDVAVLCVMLGSGNGGFFCAAFLSACLHELAHLSAMRICHRRPERVTLGLFGGNIQSASVCTSYREDLLIAAAGPAVNLLLAAAAYSLFLLRRQPLFLTLARVNATLGAVNLLPAKPLDGEKILYCLAALLTEDTPQTLFDGVSFFCQIALIFLCAANAAFRQYDLSVLVFSAYLLLWLIREEV